MTPTYREAAVVTLPVLMAFALAGCDRLDMYDQPRYEPLEASTFFNDGLSARPKVEGTVPRGHLHEDEAFYYGKEGGQPVRRIPDAAMRAIYDGDPHRFEQSYDETELAQLRSALLERGRQRFEIFCSPCHGLTGDGDGMIVRRGFRKPPSYDSERLRGAAAGFFFDVISNGFGAMSPYASRIEPADLWAIVAYIRALQYSQHASSDDLSEEDLGLLPPSADESQRERREGSP